MEPITWLIIAVVIVAVVYAKSGKGGPCDVPGPWGVPLLGYLPFLGRRPEVKFCELRRRYGDLFQLRMGRQRVVVLNSFPLIKEALNKTEFSDRPHTYSFEKIQEFNLGMGYYGVGFFSVSPKWEYLRRTTVRALNNLVVSPQNRLEHYTKGALAFFDKDVEKMKGVGTVKRTVFNAVNSVVGSMNFSRNLSPESPVLDKLYDNQVEFGEFLAANAGADFVPLLRPWAERKFAAVKESLGAVNGALSQFIREHHFDPDIRDVQDALEHVIRSDEEPEAYKAHGFSSMADVKMVAQDLFAAGTFTTTEHFLFFIRVLALKPEIGEAMRAELEAKVVRGEESAWVPLSAKEGLPYCRAVQEEMFRFASQVPFAITHWTNADVTLRGYRIPKDTLVIPNLWAVHRDPEIWKHPDEFNPQRFLTAEGEFDDQAARSVVPFSYGKRRCPGELMARRELFMLYTNFVRSYTVKAENFHGKEPFDCLPGFARILQDADFRFEKL